MPTETAVLIVLLALVAVVALVLVRRRSGGAASRSQPNPTLAAAVPDLRRRLGRTRSALAQAFRRSALDEAFWEELEEALLAADVGTEVAAELLAEVRARHPATPEAARVALEELIADSMSGADRSLHLDGNPAVILVVGVNGSGKTTTIAKLAKRLGDEGHRVVLAAADTFRAAAVEQLRTWGARLEVPVVAGASGADPASVAFEALETARRERADVVVVDTAGRLQSKTNLMDELAKIKRVLERNGASVSEVLLVLDGTTGQNAVGQAEAFRAAVDVTGLVLTKLDGTAKGGAAIAIERRLGIPVKELGVGEGLDDLVPFDPRAYAEALLEP